MSDAGEAFGDASGDANEIALGRVADLIAELQPGSMVQRFVLVVETIDAEDRWFSAFTAPGQKRWDSLGLLDYALVCERNVVLEVERDEDGDG